MGALSEESPVRIELSKKQLEEITRLENDTVKQGEGKVLRIKMGFGKEGKCLVFKNKDRVSLILIDNKMDARSLTFDI